MRGTALSKLMKPVFVAAWAPIITVYGSEIARHGPVAVNGPASSRRGLNVGNASTQ